MDKSRLLQLAGLTEKEAIVDGAKVKISSNQKTGYCVDIEKETIDNTDWRRVLYTTPDNQLVVMSLNPEQELGMEVHDNTAQFIRIEKGNGKAIIGGKSRTVTDGDSIIVPKGVAHNVINTSKTDDLKIYTVYAPPVHQDGVVEKTKAQEKKEKGIVATHKA